MDQWRATGSDIETLADAERGVATPGLRRRLRRSLQHTGSDLLARPEWWGQVSRDSLRADVLAGLTGASLVLPQGVAFAAIAGLPPEYGFYASVVPTIVAALMGSSWHAVSGATTALSALVFGTLAGKFIPGSAEFITAAISMALLVGVFQILMGVLRLGSIVDFVSHSAMTGFVSGAALLIGASQLGNALDLALPRPETPVLFLSTLLSDISQVNLASLAVAVSAIVSGLLARRLSPRMPHYLIALIMATLLAAVLMADGARLETVGAIARVFPVASMPDLSPDLLLNILSGALAVAFVGSLEAASIGRAMAARSEHIFNTNREFFGQGLSNVVGSFFSAYPSSASFTRSAINFDSGARTPLAAIFSALFLLVILLLVTPVFSHVPTAGLAGVILLVAYRLIDFREIRHILTNSTEESLIAGAAFFGTLFVGLEFAIYAGVVLSLVFFLLRISQPVIAVVAPDRSSPSRAMRSARLFELQECPQVLITSMHGPLYFGTVEATRRDFYRFRTERPSQRHILFMTPSSSEMDLPAAEVLLEEARLRQQQGGSLHIKISSLKALNKLARFRVVKALGRDYIHLSKRDAIAQIVPTLDPDICATCSARIFRECAKQPDIRDRPTQHDAKNAAGAEESPAARTTTGAPCSP